MYKSLLQTVVGAGLLLHTGAIPFDVSGRTTSEASSRAPPSPTLLSTLTMHLSQLFLATLPLPPLIPAAAANIVLSNDDGWAEINIREFYHALTQAGNSVIISAPADNESGTGSADLPATPRLTPCEYDSCPAGSSAEGFNASMRRWNYVNS